MTYINPKKESEYLEKIKDYSINILEYELEECRTNLDAEFEFGADENIVKKIKRKMELIERVIDGNQ